MSDRREEWIPQPLDTSGVPVPEEITKLVEILAEQAHAVWGQRRRDQGWRYGPQHDPHKRTHPLLVPYDELAEADKDDDRRMALQTVKLILAQGYVLTRGPNPDSADGPARP